MNEGVAPHVSSATSRKPVTDLRQWLDILAKTDRLAVARPGAKLRFELAAVAKTLDGRKATLFPRPDGHPVPVISGLTSDRGWMAEAMGVTNDRLLETFQEAALNPVPWREVSGAPVQEVVHRDVDLPRLLPIPVHNELDSGPYVTAGLLISRNPKTGIQNVTIHRMQLSGPNRLGVLLLPRHTLRFFQMAEETGNDLPVAVVIGVDPLTLLSSQAIAPLDFDELTIAGALHGKPLDVVKCLSSDIRVPAHAEIVIEGRILARTREMEGPFGEFPQYYSEPAEQHVVEIGAVTHRKNPIFHTILGGGIEHLLLGGIPREATIMAHLKRSFPGVRDVHLSRGGTCRYHLNVQLDKRHEGEGKNVIMGAFGAHYDIKHVVVVDQDVDIHDQAEVEWAIATRVQGDRDVMIVSNARAKPLDPSLPQGFGVVPTGAKVGIDATIPENIPREYYERITYAYAGSAKIDDYVNGKRDAEGEAGDEVVVERVAAQILDTIAREPLYYTDVAEKFSPYDFRTIARAIGHLHATEKLWQDPRGRLCVRGSQFAAKPPGK